MNWWDYARGYDEGTEDARNSRAGDSLLLHLLRLMMVIVSLAVKLCLFLLTMMCIGLWSIVKKVCSVRR